MIMAVLHSDPSAPSFEIQRDDGIEFFFFSFQPRYLGGKKKTKTESLTSAETHEKNDPFESKVIASNEPQCRIITQ